ncbi:hypothetical protein AWC15_15350 [Mycobacterium lacus]|nr:hypothetical protein AWC15_15350 [Mycobacterium lacus]
MRFCVCSPGHFALTGPLLDHLLPVRGSRGVTVSSVGHRIRATIHFDDLHRERRCDRIAAYGQSKLANLLFTRRSSSPAPRPMTRTRNAGPAPSPKSHRRRVSDLTGR